ncbi:hypothetical protein [Sphingomonas adhaesiva]|uniref:hypothetical protein n=1 Tax=Sphingomonas adhaesiva TaxID=28212 RepID=UPI002FF44679
MLRDAAVGLPVDAPAAQRLLYLIGPRPHDADLAWLRDRTLAGPPAMQAGWLAAYAPRDRPAAALAFVAHHPLAMRTPVLLTRLSLASAAGDDAAGAAALAALLDGRALSGDDWRAIAAATPRDLPAAQADLLARRRLAAGVATPQQRLDMAWAAWNRGGAAQTIRILDDYLADHPQDLPALRLMADAQAKAGGAAAARAYLDRALAVSPAPDRTRADLLERLGRRTEALRLVEALRAEAPADRGLAAFQARLLIALGQPGRARTVLAP